MTRRRFALLHVMLPAFIGAAVTTGVFFALKDKGLVEAKQETAPSPFTVLATNPEDGCKLTQWVGGFRVVYVTCPGVGQVTAAKY